MRLRTDLAIISAPAGTGDYFLESVCVHFFSKSSAGAYSLRVLMRERETENNAPLWRLCTCPNVILLYRTGELNREYVDCA